MVAVINVAEIAAISASPSLTRGDAASVRPDASDTRTRRRRTRGRGEAAHPAQKFSHTEGALLQVHRVRPSRGPNRRRSGVHPCGPARGVTASAARARSVRPENPAGLPHRAVATNVGSAFAGAAEQPGAGAGREAARNSWRSTPLRARPPPSEGTRAVGTRTHLHSRRNREQVEAEMWLKRVRKRRSQRALSQAGTRGRRC